MRFALDAGLLRPAQRRPGFSLRAQLSLWWRRARERRELLQMSEHDLRDIGLTRVDVIREAEKPFWRE